MLYKIDETSGAQTFFNNAFGSAPPGKKAVYYSRGPYNSCAKLLISDQQDSWGSGETPTLYLNDDDGYQPVAPDLYTEDYAIGVCSVGSVKDKYSPIAKNMTGDDDYRNDNCVRGWCDDTRTDESPGVNIDIPSFKSNILECGYEIIKVWPWYEEYSENENINLKLEKSRTLAIQSRGDAYFIFAKGFYSGGLPLIENDESLPHFINRMLDFYEQNPIDEIGPFSVANNPEGEYITIQEFRGSGLLGETKWLLTNPECLILNIQSCSEWRDQLIIPGVLSSICGFSDYSSTDATIMKNFMQSVLNQLWSCTPNNELWSCDVPNDTAILSWMENALLIHRQSGNTVFKFASAIDSSHRYYLTSGKNKNYPALRDNWYIN